MKKMIKLLFTVFFGSTLCTTIPSGDFVRVFIDSSQPISEVTMPDEEVLQVAAEMQVEAFCKRVGEEYHRHCSQLCPQVSISMNKTWPIKLTTEADYSLFLKEKAADYLIHFVWMPPGRLRQAMCEELEKKVDFAKHRFVAESFRNVDTFYPDIIHEDFFKVYDDYISQASLVKLRKLLVKVDLAASPLGRLIKPKHYSKVCMALSSGDQEAMKKCAAQLSVCFARPFPGTEKYFTIRDHKKYVAIWKGFVDVVELCNALAPLSVIKFEDISKLTIKQLEMTLEGLLMAFQYMDPLLDVQEDTVRQFIMKALPILSEDAARVYEDLFRGKCKSIVNFIGPLHTGNMVGNVSYSSDIVNEIAGRHSIPAELSSAHRVSPFSDGPANPRLFLKIITGNNLALFSGRLRLAPQYLSHNDVALLKDINSTVFDGSNDDHGSALVDSEGGSLKDTWQIRHLLHSLFFNLGAFGDGMNDGLRDAYKAVAKLMYPRLWSRLLRFAKFDQNKRIVRPYVMELLRGDKDVDLSWVIEHYLVLPRKSDIKSIMGRFLIEPDVNEFVTIVADYAKKHTDPSISAVFMPRIVSIIKFLAVAGFAEKAQSLLRIFTNNPKSAIYQNRIEASGPQNWFFQIYRDSLTHNLLSYASLRPFSVQAVEYLLESEFDNGHRFNWSQKSAAFHIALFARRIIYAHYDRDTFSKRHSALMKYLRMDPYFVEKDFDIVFGKFTLIELYAVFKGHFQGMFKLDGKTETTVDARIIFLKEQNENSLKECFLRLLEMKRTAMQATDEMMNVLVATRNTELAKVLIDFAIQFEKKQ